MDTLTNWVLLISILAGIAAFFLVSWPLGVLIMLNALMIYWVREVAYAIHERFPTE